MVPNMQGDLMFSQIFDWQIYCRCLFYSLILLVYTLFHFVIQTLYIFLSPYSFSSGFAFSFSVRMFCSGFPIHVSLSSLVLQPCTEIRNCNHNTYSSSTLSWLWARESWNPLFFKTLETLFYVIKNTVFLMIFNKQSNNNRKTTPFAFNRISNAEIYKLACFCILWKLHVSATPLERAVCWGNSVWSTACCSLGGFFS